MDQVIYLPYINLLHERFAAGSAIVQVVLGPRQVGRTTTVLKLIDNHYSKRAHYVSADKVFNADAGWLREHWLTAQSEKKILFIDEVQKAYN